uniref:Putative secreted protein n=1 Tax=Anopheles triannulatus TaxID=58253 RepID=A0A2M4B106_9DIPT
MNTAGLLLILLADVGSIFRKLTNTTDRQIFRGARGLSSTWRLSPPPTSNSTRCLYYTGEVIPNEKIDSRSVAKGFRILLRDEPSLDCT